MLEIRRNVGLGPRKHDRATALLFFTRLYRSSTPSGFCPPEVLFLMIVRLPEVGDSYLMRVLQIGALTSPTVVNGFDLRSNGLRDLRGCKDLQQSLLASATPNHAQQTPYRTAPFFLLLY